MEQKVGFLGRGPRLRSANSFREISAKGSVPEPAALSELNAKRDGGAILRVGRRVLLGPAVVNSSEEFSVVNNDFGGWGLAVVARLRRVTKRPVEGRCPLEGEKLKKDEEQRLQQALPCRGDNPPDPAGFF